VTQHPEPTLTDVKAWIASITSAVGRHERGQDVRDFGKWASDNGCGRVDYDVVTSRDLTLRM
jgi:hypothetical protein